MTDLTKTRIDLIERAATELGALTSGQALADEDAETIGALLDPLVRQLSFDGIVDVADTEAIPSEYFLPLARLLANEAQPSFGAPWSRDVKLENEHQLRRLTSTRTTREPLRSIYY